MVAISQKPRRPTRETVEFVATKKQLNRRSQRIATRVFAVDIKSDPPVIPSGGNPVTDVVQELTDIRPARRMLPRTTLVREDPTTCTVGG
jgi:hypothetical protein